MRFTIGIILMFATLASTSRIHRYESRNNIDKYTQECGVELKISPSDLNKYSTPYMPEDAVGQCFRKCMFEKFGILDKDSAFKPEEILKLMSQNNHPLVGDADFISRIEKCAKEANLIENACERALRGAKCFNSESMKNKKIES
ncbi:general odorant-binding protein 99a-like [Episyrphus balteatus]|uniref:general odorant-binding protein 99a-like n=1 Tax=Episyrphus balteatus TaxID=286459 RepID=UPI0024867BA8|nr:general odorant-binding protein 99a-like [Episyrphus balteatus]